MSASLSVRNIPLRQLVLSPLNVSRVPATAAEDTELKASMRARGVLQNLLVHASPDSDSIFAVHGGGRRRQILQALATEQIIAR